MRGCDRVPALVGSAQAGKLDLERHPRSRSARSGSPRCWAGSVAFPARRDLDHVRARRLGIEADGVAAGRRRTHRRHHGLCRPSTNRERPSSRPSSLRSPFTSMIGRNADVEQAARAFHDELRHAGGIAGITPAGSGEPDEQAAAVNRSRAESKSRCLAVTMSQTTATHETTDAITISAIARHSQIPGGPSQAADTPRSSKFASGNIAAKRQAYRPRPRRIPSAISLLPNPRYPLQKSLRHPGGRSHAGERCHRTQQG